MAAVRVPASAGKPYVVSRINGHRLCLSRGGNSIPLAKSDLAAVFTVLYELLNESESNEYES